MTIDWVSVIEIVTAGMLLAVLAGLGALAFRDWDVYRRLFWRLMIVVGILFLLAALWLSVWHFLNQRTIFAELQSAVASDFPLPPVLREAVELDNELDEMGLYWVVLPIGVFFLYIITLFLFARPVIPKEKKPGVEIQRRKALLKRLENSAARARDELKELIESEASKSGENANVEGDTTK